MTDDFYTEKVDFIDVFKFVRSTDEAVEAWAQTLDQLIANTPKSELFYILLDVRGEEVTFSTSAREQSKRVFSKHQKRKGYIAMLFEWRTSPYFARLFFSTIGKLGFKLKYFHQEDVAYAWLNQMYEENK